jgi:hypothetical protein
MTIFLKK